MSEGTATIEFPLGDMWPEFDVLVVLADVLILHGLRHMDRLGIYFENFNNVLVHPATGHKKIDYSEIRPCIHTMESSHGMSLY